VFYDWIALLSLFLTGYICLNSKRYVNGCGYGLVAIYTDCLKHRRWCIQL